MASLLLTHTVRYMESPLAPTHPSLSPARVRSLFSFPNPVNEYAARTVAFGVVLLSVVAIVLRQPWLIVVLGLGFWARVLTGPRLSPLGRLATQVIAPRIRRPARMVPGPPKRFAQGIGAALSSVAVLLWFGGGHSGGTWVVLGLLTAAALLEAVFGLCLGCKAFALLMRVGVIPDSICTECADLTRARTPRPPA